VRADQLLPIMPPAEPITIDDDDHSAGDENQIVNEVRRVWRLIVPYSPCWLCSQEYKIWKKKWGWMAEDVAFLYLTPSVSLTHVTS
jgi:hypothetical protein